MKVIFRNLLLLGTALLLVLPADARQKKKTKKKTVKNSQVAVKNTAPMIVYTESYGSVCCPRDIHWDQEFFTDYVTRFNTEHKVSVKEIYSQARGREGEQIFLVTLSELSPALKKKFVEQRIVQETPERKEEVMKLFQQPQPVSTFINDANASDLLLK